MKILIDGPDQILYQWDKGQRLMLHGADAGTRVDFARCNDNKAVSKYAYADDGAVFCDIPDALLMEPNHIHGYVYEIDGDRGTTVREFMLPVIRRPMPEDYVAPDEVLTWHELEQRIKKIEDEGVPDEKIERAVEDYLEENPIEAPKPDLTGVVKSVNGKTPDENGNVEITIPDSSQKVNWNDIEDRPFYEDVKVLFEGEIDYSNSAYSEISPPIEFVEGVEYKVNVNGNVCSGIANFDSDQCEVVAYLYKEGENDWCGILTSYSLSMFDIDALSSVKIYISTVKQLEEKYIEDSVQPKTGPFFCKCTSSGSTANKTAKAQAFSIDALRVGMLVAVNFTAANTATSGVTLSIDGTEAKMIRDAGLNNGTPEITKGTHLLVFNGTYWIMLT